jgi:hypothetical protein
MLTGFFEGPSRKATRTVTVLSYCLQAQGAFHIGKRTRSLRVIAWGKYFGRRLASIQK